MIPPDHDWLDVLAAVAGILIGLGGIGALITALIYVTKIRTEKKASQAETRHIDAETSSLYQDIADRSAERSLKLDIRVAVLEALIVKQSKELQRLPILEAIVEKQAKELQRLREENADLRDWAERLVHQVQGLGGQPVGIRAKSEGI
jgi:hypothetical protein